MPSGKIKAKVLDVIDGKLGETENEVEVPFFLKENDATPPGYGKPVTAEAAQMMLDGFIEERVLAIEQALGRRQPMEVIDALLESPVYVDFGREALLQILAQSNCEGIRFYFIINHNGRPSLYLRGYDSSLADVGIPATVPSGSGGAEKPVYTFMQVAKGDDQGLGVEVGPPYTFQKLLELLKNESLTESQQSHRIIAESLLGKYAAQLTALL